MNDLRSILEARRAEHVQNITARDGVIDTHRREMEKLATANRVSFACIAEIDFALEQLPAADAVVTAPLADKPKPEKPPQPRDAAAWAILNAYSTADIIPDDINELPAQIRDQWSGRSLRAGLNIAKIKRLKFRAAEASPSVDDPPVASAENGGAEASFGGEEAAE